MIRLFLAAAFAFLAGGAPDVLAQSPAPQAVEIRSSPIERFRLGSGETRFGALEFVGGFEMRSSNREFGQLSALRFLTPGGDFVGVADHGYWFFGTIARDDAGIPLGVENFRMQPILDEDGRVTSDKERVDAEGLSVHEGVATVSFERRPRLSEYAFGPGGAGVLLRHLDHVVPRHELRYNQGLETVVHAPEGGALEGARIVIAERSIDENGDIFAAIVEGPQKGIFKVRRTDSFDVTDGVFLPGGDLLLLERRFSMALGVAMRLRRIAGERLRAGALLDGEVLVEADLAFQIDNMEGIDVWQRADGATVVSLVSDNNQSFLQRTLYLEFVLVE